MFVQISLFNDADHVNQFHFYIKQGRVKTEWGVSRREGERGREEQINRVRDGA
jgi:hypothetical protein